jgi:hypothetical protein
LSFCPAVLFHGARHNTTIAINTIPLPIILIFSIYLIFFLDFVPFIFSTFPLLQPNKSDVSVKVNVKVKVEVSVKVNVNVVLYFY